MRTGWLFVDLCEGIVWLWPSGGRAGTVCPGRCALQSRRYSAGRCGYPRSLCCRCCCYSISLRFALLIYVFLISAIWWAAVSHLVPVIFTHFNFNIIFTLYYFPWNFGKQSLFKDIRKLYYHSGGFGILSDFGSDHSDIWCFGNKRQIVDCPNTRLFPSHRQWIRSRNTLWTKPLWICFAI